ncbi:MAG: hypothetical protein IPN69_24470 [Acidobacteria bacterium]|nr:hypothetical protein [Acidobacteriota bacterium]
MTNFGLALTELPPSSSAKRRAYLSNSGSKIHALDKLGRRAEGLTELESGLKLYLTYLNANRKDPEAMAFAPEMLEIPAGFFSDRGDRRRSAMIWEDCADRLSPFLAASPGDGGFSQRVSDCLRRQDDVLGGAREGSAVTATAAERAKALALYKRALETIRGSKVKSPIFQSRIEELEATISAQ